LLAAIVAAAIAVVLAAAGILLLRVVAVAFVMAPAAAAAPAALPLALLVLVAALIVAAAGLQLVTTTIAIIITIAIAIIIIAIIIALLIVHDLHGIGSLAGTCALDRLLLAFASALLQALGLHLHAALALLLEQPVARHRRHHDAEVMFRMLQEVLVLHTVAGRLRVTGELGVLFVDLGSGSPDLHIRTIALKGSVAVVVTTATTAAAAGLAPAPPLTLHETILIFRIFAPVGRILGSATAGPKGAGRLPTTRNRLLTRDLTLA
jgi:hypothetical protein